MGAAAEMEAAEAELAEVNTRLSKYLRQIHPELFDSNGEMIESEYRRKLAERPGSTGIITDAELRRVDAERRHAAHEVGSGDAT